ncbi:MAG: FAD-binding oxidoreductase [Pseudomonadales bacterium]
MTSALKETLNSILPELDIVSDPDSLQSYASDWTKESPVTPEIVLRPETTEQLSIILNTCNSLQQPVVTQGGLTGLSGGATPHAGEVAISLSKMRGIVELDKKGQTITVKAGTPLQEIQEAADAAGFKLTLDLGARGNCSIGGNVATNAGGNQVIKYGMAREQVLGLEAVKADGTVLSAMNQMLKNNAGYDLKHLFIGTEGSLGIITQCVLRLHPKTRGRQTALCGCETFDSVVTLLQQSQASFGSVSSFEVMWSSFYRYAMENVEYTRDPLQSTHAYYVLIEIESDGSEYAAEHCLEQLSNFMEQGLISDVVLAQSERESADFWNIRDSIADILGLLAPLANFDIGVPIKHMEEFVGRVEQELNANYDKLTLIVFGHLGDGNLHLCASTGDYADKKKIYADVYRISAAYGATVTAEHGIGMNKKPYLALTRSEAEINTMRELKRCLDPNNILNRGRVFDL